jgi:hypothetical protein
MYFFHLLISYKKNLMKNIVYGVFWDFRFRALKCYPSCYFGPLSGKSRPQDVVWTSAHP